MVKEVDLNMKFVLIGDGAVGKTSLLSTFINKGFPKEYVPTVMDQFKVELPFSNDTVKLEVWDTAGQENLGELRNLSYPNTHLFIICYSCVERASFSNISSVWMDEVKSEKGVQFVLTGTKSDLIEEVKTEQGPNSVVLAEEGERLKNKLEADGAFQCSALKNDGVQEVFKRSIKVVYDKRVPVAAGCGCAVL